MKTNLVEVEFVPQIPIRNQLFICSIEIGEESGRKSALERALRIGKNRYIVAPGVVSYRFLSVGRILKAILASFCGHPDVQNRLGSFMDALFALETLPSGIFQAELQPFWT